jgi:hypothetical protein
MQDCDKHTIANMPPMAGHMTHNPVNVTAVSPHPGPRCDGHTHGCQQMHPPLPTSARHPNGLNVRHTQQVSIQRAASSTQLLTSGATPWTECTTTVNDSNVEGLPVTCTDLSAADGCSGL